MDTAAPFTFEPQTANPLTVEKEASWTTHEEDGWWAESADMPGSKVAADSYTDLCRRITEHMALLYRSYVWTTWAA